MLYNSLFSLLFILLFPVVALAQQSNPANLDSYQWENRLLLVFSPSETAANYQMQIEILRGEEDGLNDRDMKIFHLTNDESASVDEEVIPKVQVQRLADKYNVDPGVFTVILIGKDGSEKMRQNKPLKTGKLFSVIDAMPMRQNEMQNE